MDLLAPGVTEHHISGGFNYKLTRNSSFDAAFVYGFKNSVSSFERVPFTLITLPPPINMSIPVMPTINPKAHITTWLRGLEFLVGYNYKFDVGDASLITSHL
jgi:long-chain fatty acid transport protein